VAVRFVTDCVHAPNGEDIGSMVDTARRITRHSFLRAVGRRTALQVELRLGYEAHAKRGLTMARDWHVSYARSIYRGRPCWYFTWSAIEYIFQDDEERRVT